MIMMVATAQVVREQLVVALMEEVDVMQVMLKIVLVMVIAALNPGLVMALQIVKIRLMAVI